MAGLVEQGGTAAKSYISDKCARGEVAPRGRQLVQDFKRIDADDSNTLAFEEFRHMCRSIYPGLNIDRKLLPDGLLRGLWRGIDADSSGNVTVQEFMVFMRAHAAHLDSMAGYTHPMHELAFLPKSRGRYGKRREGHGSEETRVIAGRCVEI